MESSACALFFHNAAAHIGPFERWYMLPTLAWISSGNLALNAVCAVGMRGRLTASWQRSRPGLCCSLLWALYLTLAGADHTFLSFQWDSLLIETLFLGIFLSPTRLFLARWLLFKLMLSSGICKISRAEMQSGARLRP